MHLDNALGHPLVDQGEKNFNPSFKVQTPHLHFSLCLYHCVSCRGRDGLHQHLNPHPPHKTGCVPSVESRAFSLFLRKIEIEDVTKEDDYTGNIIKNGLSYEISVVCSLQSQVQERGRMFLFV